MVFTAFSVMLIISNYFSSNIVRKNMDSYGEKVVLVAAEAINLYLNNYASILENLSSSVEKLHADGAGINRVRQELELWTQMLHKRSGELDLSVIFYGFMYDTFLDGGGRVPDNDFIPQARPWYIGAYAHNGEVFFSEPYRDAETNEYCISLSMLVFDVNNRPFGVIATDVFMSGIAEYVENMRFMGNGYGVLLDRQQHIAVDNPYYSDIVTMRVIMSAAGLFLALLLCGVLAYMHIRINKSDEANKTKTSFLANMSHEIRTPMNSILGFTELAMDDEPSQKTRDYLSKIQSSTEWLLQIINDILDISKIESGKMELEKIPFEMHELFTSCRALVMPKAVEKGLVLHFYAEPSVGKRPLGDPTRLRQVFVNLLSNAIKFTNTGMVKLLSEVTSVSDKTMTMHFEIKDSGIGMTSEQIDKIFNLFAQAETGTTRKYGGTGLGLSISKNIVEMMGGKLCVESVIGVGSKFSFDLVFDTVDISEEESINKNSFLVEIEKPFFEGEVLVCEDNIMNQQVITDHLKRVGLKAVVAENGKIGLDMIKNRLHNNQKQFDLVFMDIHMPVMDGFEASAEIYKLNVNISVVAMTANIMAEDIDIYKTSGMLDCVGKPFTSQQLWRCLLRYFKPINDIQNNPVEAPNVKIEKLEDDPEFFKSLLKLFAEDNGSGYEDIVKALDSNNIVLAHRLAHSLKSNAGQIGKTKLQKAAAEIEKNIKDGENHVSREQLSVLRNELKTVLKELKDLYGI